MRKGPARATAEIVALRGGDTSKGKQKAVSFPEGSGQLWAPPKWFDREQRKKWLSAINNAPVGLLTGSDYDTLVMWCVACVEYAKAAQEVRTMGQLVKLKGGRVIPNPYLAIMNQQIAVISKTGTQMGFNPSGRAALGKEVEASTGPLLARVGSAKIISYIDENPDALTDD